MSFLTRRDRRQPENAEKRRRMDAERKRKVKEAAEQAARTTDETERRISAMQAAVRSMNPRPQ